MKSPRILARLPIRQFLGASSAPQHRPTASDIARRFGGNGASRSQNQNPPTKPRRILATAIASLILALPGFAVTDTWDGGGGNNNISNNNNWVDNTAPVSDLLNTDLVFDGIVRLTPVFSAVFSARSLTFNNNAAANAFILGGVALTVGAGGILNNDADTQTFANSPFTVGAASVSFNAASGPLAFATTVSVGNNALSLDGAGAFSFNNFSGTGTVTKTGAGTMTWTPTAVQSLDLTISAGTVNTVADAFTDTFNASASIAVNGTSILNLRENTTLDGALLTRASGADVNVSPGKTLTIQNGGDFTVTGGFTSNIASTFVVTGAGSTFTATSALTVGTASTTNILAGGSVSSGGTLAIGNMGAGTVTVDGNASSISGGTTTIGNGSLTLTDGSTGTFGGLTLNGSDGTVSIQSGASVTATSLQVVIGAALMNNGTVTINGPNSALTVSGAGVTTVGASSLSTATLNVQSGGVFNSGTGNLTVNATGDIAITNGTFNANGNVTVNGGSLTRDGAGSFVMASGKTLTAQAGGTVSFDSFQNFNGVNLIVTGAGSAITMTLNGLNINGGATIQISGGGHLDALFGSVNIGNSGAGLYTITVDGAGSQMSALGACIWGALGGVTNATFSNSAVGTFGSLALGQNSTPGSSGTVLVQSGADITTGPTFVGNLAFASTSGSVTVTGAGSTWTISGENIPLGIGAASGSTGSLTVASGGVFNSGNSAVNATGTIALNGGTFVANGGLTVNGGQFTRDAEGTFTLPATRVFNIQAGGDAIFTGPYVNSTASTINVTDAGSTFSATDALSINGGSTLNVFAGGDVSAGSTLNVGTIGNGTVSVTGSGSSLSGNFLSVGLNGATGSLTFSDTSTGAFGVIEVDDSSEVGTTGSLIIQGGATVTGTGLIIADNAFANMGTVTITGAGSALTLTGAATATIGATSSSIATLTVESGGTFTTGTGLTTVNATGDLNINAGGTMIVRGNMTVLSSLDIAGTVILDASASPAPGEFFENDPGFDAGNLLAPESNLEWGNLQTTGEIRVVPEPGIGVLLLSALTLGAFRRRRR